MKDYFSGCFYTLLFYLKWSHSGCQQQTGEGEGAVEGTAGVGCGCVKGWAAPEMGCVRQFGGAPKGT